MLVKNKVLFGDIFYHLLNSNSCLEKLFSLKYGVLTKIKLSNWAINCFLVVFGDAEFNNRYWGLDYEQILRLTYPMLMFTLFIQA